MNFDLIGGGALLTLIFGSYGFTWLIRGECRKGRKALHDKIEAATREAGDKIELVSREVGSCQTRHAELYATNADVDRLDKNISEMRRELSDKLDRINDRLVTMK